MITSGEGVGALPPDSLLGEFAEAGVLGLADVHAALGLGRICGESDELVALASALVVRALRGGSVCLDLHTAADGVFDAGEHEIDVSALPWPPVSRWLAACRASPMVTQGAEDPGERPLRLLGSTVYLERYWAEEEIVRTQLLQRRALRSTTLDLPRLQIGLDRIFSPADLAADEPDRQRIAAATAVLGHLTVLAGGPGTGKTTTVAKVLALLADQPSTRPPRMALAAPTGKAAARLAEAVGRATAELPPEDAQRIGTVPSSTLHRLLGSLPDRRGRFRHHQGNPLPYDVVVVDEMSMVSLPMMARLLEAVRPGAHLVLVGDPDQLSSVEAGAVMADIAGAAQDAVARPGAARVPDGADVDQADADRVEPDRDRAGTSGYAALPALAEDGRGLALPPDTAGGVVRLTHTWRFGGAIGLLAAAVRDGDPDRAWAILQQGHADVQFHEVAGEQIDPDALPAVRRAVQSAGTELVAAARDGDPVQALRALDRHRLLCAHRTGPAGVARWAWQTDRWLAAAGQGRATPITEGAGPAPATAPRPTRDEWYVGRPILITANDYALGLFNGDTGVVIAGPDGPRAVFARGNEVVAYAPARLEDVQTVHAMTVHRSQGSQFEEVSVILPPADSPLLTRELLYTAVTRATSVVRLIGSADAIRRAVTRPANRASGLRHRLN